MATTKVSALAALTTPDGNEELLINDGGTSKKITLTNAIIAGTGITRSGATISASPVALTTIQTAANQSAQLALTTQEGDVVVRSDESKTYMHNGGSAGNMNDFTEMATPTGGVTSVNSVTGAVTAAHIATAVEAASDSNTFTDADHSKLNAIEASADVTDATNVDAAGALMKSGGTLTGDLNFGDNVDANFGAAADLKIFHSGSNSIIRDSGEGALYLESNQVFMTDAAGNENMFKATENGSVELYHNNAKKLETTGSGVTVTGNIANASGNLTLDVGGDLYLDADGGNWRFNDGGTDIGLLKNSSSDFQIESKVQDKDIKFVGNDGGSSITALTLDMSNAGAATFNSYVDLGTNNIYTGDNGKAIFGSNEDLKIYHDGSNSLILETGTGDLIVQGANVHLKNGSGNSLLYGSTSATTVYHNGSAKLETTSGGIAVTGDMYSSTGMLGLAAGNDIQFVNNNSQRFHVNNLENMRLEADGDLHVDGDVIAYSTTTSDERLKDNIEVVEGALDKVKELKGVTFTRKQDGVESAGVIAQDVEKVLPQAVKHKALPLQTGNDELFKTVQYDALHALLIEAVKELSEKVEKLENK